MEAGSPRGSAPGSRSGGSMSSGSGDAPPPAWQIAANAAWLLAAGTALCAVFSGAPLRALCQPPSRVGLARPRQGGPPQRAAARRRGALPLPLPNTSPSAPPRRLAQTRSWAP